MNEQTIFYVINIYFANKRKNGKYTNIFKFVHSENCLPQIEVEKMAQSKCKQLQYNALEYIIYITVHE